MKSWLTFSWGVYTSEVSQKWGYVLKKTAQINLKMRNSWKMVGSCYQAANKISLILPWVLCLGTLGSPLIIVCKEDVICVESKWFVMFPPQWLIVKVIYLMFIILLIISCFSIVVNWTSFKFSTVGQTEKTNKQAI